MTLVFDPPTDLEAAGESVADGNSIPYRWYSDPEVFQFELESIWRSSWHVAGPLEKVANIGDHFVCEASGIPIFVVRDQTNTLRAFLNVCRHRGYQVVREEGNRRALQCQYHAWTYNLDGTLKGAPGCQLDPTFRKDEMSLIPVGVDTIAGVVFVNPDVNAPPLRAAHPVIESWATSLNLDFRAYPHVTQLCFDAPGNWKLVYENASECYHCPTIHPTSLTSLYDPHGEREICDDTLVIAQAPRLDKDGLGIRAIMGFPGFILQQDDFVAISAQIFPDAPGQTRLLADVYGNPECTEEALAEHCDLWQRTFREDMDVVATVYKSVASGMMAHGRLVVPKEQRTAHIQRVIVDAYRHAADAASVA
jgi:choline monooxygenase